MNGDQGRSGIQQVRTAAAVGGVALLILGGHQALSAVLAGGLLRPDLAQLAGVSSVLAAVAVKMTAMAFWPAMAVRMLRVGIAPAVLGFGLRVTVTVLALRMAVEIGLGARLGGVALTAVAATTIGAVSAVLASAPRSSRRRSAVRAVVDRRVRQIA